MNLNTCRVVSQTEVAEGIRLLILEGDAIVRKGRPGQFVHIRVGDGLFPLWRRPFSIHGIDPANGTFRILYRVLGAGTAMLGGKKSGDFLNVLGPLGNGFDLDRSYPRALIVAGGVGSAALFFLADALSRKGKSVTFLWGVRKKSELFGEDDLVKRSVDLRISSDDGSAGFRGLVTDLLKKTLRADKLGNRDAAGFVCGPKGMIRQVQTIAVNTDVPWQVSLEEKMACGINVCKGCAVKMRHGGYGMACSDGPVFDLREVILED